jgi:transcriptional regulator with XRE-family HTH domain
MNLGNKIRELRRSRNLTQEQLAASLNVSAQAVSKWEMSASYPDMTMIPVLAGFFKVSLDELFDFDVNSIGVNAVDAVGSLREGGFCLEIDLHVGSPGG